MPQPAISKLLLDMAHTFIPEVSAFSQLISELFFFMVVCKEVEHEITELNLCIRLVTLWLG